jgi:hypothetical protein
VHLNETTLNRVKGLGMTEKGKKSEFLIVIGEKAETTHSLHIVPTPLEYWMLTTFPRERWYREWWLATNSHPNLIERYEALAKLYPNGLSDLPELPEERSGEVSRVGGVNPNTVTMPVAREAEPANLDNGNVSLMEVEEVL